MKNGQTQDRQARSIIPPRTVAGFAVSFLSQYHRARSKSTNTLLFEPTTMFGGSRTNMGHCRNKKNKAIEGNWRQLKAIEGKTRQLTTMKIGDFRL